MATCRITMFIRNVIQLNKQTAVRCLLRLQSRSMTILIHVRVYICNEFKGSVYTILPQYHNSTRVRDGGSREFRLMKKTVKKLGFISHI